MTVKNIIFSYLISFFCWRTILWYGIVVRKYTNYCGISAITCWDAHLFAVLLWILKCSCVILCARKIEMLILYWTVPVDIYLMPPIAQCAGIYMQYLFTANTNILYWYYDNTSMRKLKNTILYYEQFMDIIVILNDSNLSTYVRTYVRTFCIEMYTFFSIFHGKC